MAYITVQQTRDFISGRRELKRLASIRLIHPLSTDQQVRYDLLCGQEQELVVGIG